MNYLNKLENNANNIIVEKPKKIKIDKAKEKKTINRNFLSDIFFIKSLKLYLLRINGKKQKKNREVNIKIFIKIFEVQ